MKRNNGRSLARAKRLEDYGYPKRPLNCERTAVILGNALGGEKHYLTSLRVYFPEYARELSESASFAALPETMRRDIFSELHSRVGEAPAGDHGRLDARRIGQLPCWAHREHFQLPRPQFHDGCGVRIRHGGNQLRQLHGWWRTISTPLSPAASIAIWASRASSSSAKSARFRRPAPAPMRREPTALSWAKARRSLLLKRLADAERDGDKIYAVLRGIAGSSDGKGKGITAPNPVGQKLAVERAWQNAGVSPATVTLIEGHGTSTRVGDVVEAQSMAEVLSSSNLPVGSVALGLGQVEHRPSERSCRSRRIAENRAGASGQGTAAQRELPAA